MKHKMPLALVRSEISFNFDFGNYFPMKLKLIIIALFCFFAIGAAFMSQKIPRVEAITPCPAETKPFPSYNTDFPPFERWCGKVFQLSQNYTQASALPDVQPWKRIVQKREDFKSKWKEYLISVLTYAYQGNIEADWVVQQNKTRKWFHAPWMHSGITGREFVHGLTMERSSCLSELTEGKPCSDDNVPIQNWAVSVYNEPGGYYIGKVWQEMYNKNLDPTKPNPKPNPARFPADGFPEGTVAIKLLFTQADVDYLKRSVVWNADIYRSKAPPQKMRLLQIDISVRDDNSPTGWVFGTFIYNDNVAPVPYGAALSPEQQAWLRVVPIGLMYGNSLEENFINSPDEIKIPQHLGCGNRLNGPVDNYRSSCIACHATAEAMPDFSYVRYQDSMNCKPETNSFWFRNINPRSTNKEEKTLSAIKNKPTVSLDYSLQVRKGIERCCEAKVCRCSQPTLDSKTQEVTKDGISK